MSCLEGSMVVMRDCVLNGVQFGWVGLFLFGFHGLFIGVEKITIIYFIVYLVHTLTVWPYVYMFLYSFCQTYSFRLRRFIIQAAVCFLYVCIPELFLLNLNPNQFLLSGLLHFYCNLPPT